MEQQELLRLIEQAAREGWTALDLSNQGLTELPPEIGQLTKLIRLDVRFNKLTILPREITKLYQLKRIDLRGNLLQQLPSEIGELKNLIGFDCRDNQLTALPHKIEELINLEWLSIEGNRLTNLPLEVTKLLNLRELYVRGNQLYDILPEIGKLKNLQVLSLTDNRLTKLPEEMWQLNRLEKLSLGENQLSILSSKIGLLTELIFFYIGGNFLTTLPPEIGNLSKLTQIEAAGNRLMTLPQELALLSHLTELDLRDNPLPIPFQLLDAVNKPAQILEYYWGHQTDERIAKAEEMNDQIEIYDLPLDKTKILEIIEEATQKKMSSLRLSNNQLTILPKEIGNLTQLRQLSISRNPIGKLPAEIKNLTNLRSLSLNNDYLTDIPKEIGQLTSLEWLSFKYNQIQAIPREIGQLANLKGLYFEGNQLTELPQEIKKLTNLQRLELQGNSLPIPPEILRYPNQPQKILNYYFQHGPKKPLHEVKVLIVGQGAVGKTSLIKRLLDDSFNPLETKTDGIAINQWHLPVPSTAHSTSSGQGSGGADIRLNLWDFGGQEIMHATHQFFLTKRSLYVLVLDSRLDEQNNRVEYWLKIIQSFGGDSPIIVVCNKCDEHSLDLNWKGLQEKYPTIKAFAKRLSCKTGEGLAELRSLIVEEIGKMPHLHDELLLTWFAVKARLEQMAENYIGYNDYQQMCVAEQVTDELSQQTLLGFLHDLGVVLHFHDHPILEDTNVLNPEWVTRGIYQIVNSNELFQRKGELERSALAHILPAAEYPRSKHPFILDMMRKFELCFDFAESSGERLLVPDLLSREEPYTGEWGDSLAFQYHYDILPGSVMSRFMVRMHAYIHQKTYWRNGVVLISDDGQNRALVKADPEDRKIRISISGRPETRSLFLAIIRADFRKIHATIPRLNLKEVIPLPGHPDVTIDYADLLKLREKRISSYYYPKADAEINVNQLLDGLDPAKGLTDFENLSGLNPLPFAVQQQITVLLTGLPNLHDANGQRALVYSAGIDPAIQDHLRFGLPAAEFVSLLVTTLSRHGRLTDGRPALLAVLEAAKQFLGRDAQAQCDALMQAFPLHL